MEGREVEMSHETTLGYLCPTWAYFITGIFQIWLSDILIVYLALLKVKEELVVLPTIYSRCNNLVSSKKCKEESVKNNLLPKIWEAFKYYIVIFLQP